MEIPPIVHTMGLSIERHRPSLFQRQQFWGYLTASLILVAGILFGFSYFEASPAQASLDQSASATQALDPFAALSLQAKSVYVYDIKAEKILYEKNADAQLPLASITKVPLAIVVSEALSDNTTVTIPPGYASKDLAPGQRWRVRDILDYTLVSSSNTGAEILAQFANEPIRARFPQSDATASVWRMNQLAKDLGLTQTYFLNASGLDLSTTQSGAYGSARDIGTLFSYAVQNWSSVFSRTARDDISLTSIDGAKISASNTDEALRAIPGLIMGKTGYTDLAGGNLAVVFDIGPAHPIVAVVLGSTYDGRFDDMKKIAEAARASIAH